MARTGIPGFDEKRPPLGRLQQLVDNHHVDGNTIGPTDGSFAALVGLRARLEDATRYLPAQDMPALQQLEQQRHEHATRAFASAALPGRLLAFYSEGMKLDLLFDAGNDKDLHPQFRKRMGAFALTYTASHTQTAIAIHHEPFFGRRSEVLSFTATPQGEQFVTCAYQLLAVAPRHLPAVLELPEKLEAQVIAVKNRRQREATARSIQAHKY